MPDVYVIPPEEEQHETPPWCYFDAQIAKASLATSPDMEALDVALNFFQQTDNRSPLFSREFANMSQETIVMPKQNGTPLQVVEESQESPSKEIPIPKRNPKRDSDVVEVIKVKRGEGLSDVNASGSQTTKKSKTFRARATQAFKSIRNVGKSSRKFPHPEPSLQKHTPENDAHSSTFPRPTTPGMTRSKSVHISTFFSTTRKTRPPIVIPDEPPSPTSRVAPWTSKAYSTMHRSSPSLGDRTNAPVNFGDDEPGPSLSRSKSTFRKRMSALDLHRLFNVSSLTLSSPKEDHELPDDPHSHSHSHSQSQLRDSAPMTVVSPDPPRLPETMAFEDDVSSGAGSSTDLSYPSKHYHNFSGRYSPAFSSSSSTMSGLQSPRPSGDDDVEMETEDLDLELRLDSFHFDGLQFNPEDF